MGKEVNWAWSVKQLTMLLSYPGAIESRDGHRDVLAQKRFCAYLPWRGCNLTLSEDLET